MSFHSTGRALSLLSLKHSIKKIIIYDKFTSTICTCALASRLVGLGACTQSLAPGPSLMTVWVLTLRPRPARLPSVCHSHACQSVTGTECEMVPSAADPKAKGIQLKKKMQSPGNVVSTWASEIIKHGHHQIIKSSNSAFIHPQRF